MYKAIVNYNRFEYDLTFFMSKLLCKYHLPKCLRVEKLGLSWNLQLFFLEIDGFLTETLPQRLHFLLSTISASVKDFISGLVWSRRLDCIGEIIGSYRLEFLCGIQF